MAENRIKSGLEIRREQLQELKKVVRSLLLTSKDGLTLEQFKEDYKNYEGRSFPFDGFGFSSDIELLLKLKDVVRFGFNKNGERALFAIADKSCVHIQTLVEQQRDAVEVDVIYRNGNIGHFVPQRPLRHKRNFIPIYVRKRTVDILYKFSPSGVQLITFTSLYMHEFNENFNYEDYGFDNLEDCINGMSDVCEIHRIGTYSPIIRLLKSLYVHITKHESEQDRYESFVFKSMFDRIISKYPVGVSALNFCQDYLRIYGRELNPVTWGYTSPIEIFTSLPSIFIVIPANEDCDIEYPNRRKDDHYLLNAKNKHLTKRY